MKDNRIIELVGMPAVGKTTYMLNHISQKRRFVDANALLPTDHTKRQIYAFCASAYCLIKKPKMTIKSFFLILNSRQKSFRDFLKVFSNWLLVNYQYEVAIRDRKKSWVFDQGLFQACWSINYSARKPVDMSAVLYGCIKSSIVVILDIDDETLSIREKNRDKTIRLDYTDRKDVADARKAFDMTVSLIEQYYT